jgi:hypothetical protein
MLTVASQEFSCSLQRKIYVSLFNDDGLHSIIINWAWPIVGNISIKQVPFGLTIIRLNLSAMI